eukprot:maker-scaffold439_size171548-snap-gene-0.21 protein:Tk02655 transcript:maker-scaffold439_size171548-snap-gene-0.21-mRNA-1 annotation:"unknown"
MNDQVQISGYLRVNVIRRLARILKRFASNVIHKSTGHIQDCDQDPEQPTQAEKDQGSRANAIASPTSTAPTATGKNKANRHEGQYQAHEPRQENGAIADVAVVVMDGLVEAGGQFGERFLDIEVVHHGKNFVHLFLDIIMDFVRWNLCLIGEIETQDKDIFVFTENAPIGFCAQRFNLRRRFRQVELVVCLDAVTPTLHVGVLLRCNNSPGVPSQLSLVVPSFAPNDFTGPSSQASHGVALQDILTAIGWILDFGRLFSRLDLGKKLHDSLPEALTLPSQGIPAWTDPRPIKPFSTGNMNGAIYLVLWNLVPLALSYRFSAVSSWGNLGRSSGLENPYGSPDYYSPLTPPYGMFTKSMELIQRQSRKQAMIMAENALSTEDDCMHREFCRIGAFEVDDRPGEFEAVIATLKMLANMDEEFGSDNEIPHMAKIMTAYHVGVISKDKALCNHVFTCKRAGLSSLNELTVHAVAMETWRAFHSQDRPDGSRNALGQRETQMVFLAREAEPRTVSTTSEVGGVVALFTFSSSRTHWISQMDGGQFSGPSKDIEDTVRALHIQPIVDGLVISKLRYGLPVFGQVRLQDTNPTHGNMKKLQGVLNDLMSLVANKRISDKISCVDLSEMTGIPSLNRICASATLKELKRASDLGWPLADVLEPAKTCYGMGLRSQTYFL